MEQEAWRLVAKDCHRCWKYTGGVRENIVGKKNPLRSYKHVKVPCIENWRLKNRRKYSYPGILLQTLLKKEQGLNKKLSEVKNSAENFGVHRTHCNEQGLALTLGVMHPLRSLPNSESFICPRSLFLSLFITSFYHLSIDP